MCDPVQRIKKYIALRSYRLLSYLIQRHDPYNYTIFLPA